MTAPSVMALRKMNSDSTPREQAKPVMSRSMRWILAGLCYATFAAWAIAAAWLIGNQGDRMIFFHPVILAIFPGVIVGAFSAIILFVGRQWWLGTALFLGVLTLFLVFRRESDLASLVARTGMEYSRVGAGDWHIWSTE